VLATSLGLQSGKADAAGGHATGTDAARESAGNDVAGEPRKDGRARGEAAADASIGSAPPLPLPGLPDVPPLHDLSTGSDTEATPAAGAGTTVKISLGDVRQAVSGHAIVAKVTAVMIAVTKGPDRHASGRGAPDRGGVVLNLDLGLLEAAAVAPELAGGASSAVSGDGGGLPVTGAALGGVIAAGLGLLLGGVALLVARRRREDRQAA